MSAAPVMASLPAAVLFPSTLRAKGTGLHVDKRPSFGYDTRPAENTVVAGVSPIVPVLLGDE